MNELRCYSDSIVWLSLNTTVSNIKFALLFHVCFSLSYKGFTYFFYKFSVQLNENMNMNICKENYALACFC